MIMNRYYFKTEYTENIIYIRFTNFLFQKSSDSTSLIIFSKNYIYNKYKLWSIINYPSRKLSFQ